MLQCPFCNNDSFIEENIQNKRYLQCVPSNSNVGCGGFFLYPDFFAQLNEQKERYMLHTNSLGAKSETNGYRKYLEKFLATVLDYEKTKVLNGEVRRLFDYGSGPSPALVELLGEYSRDLAFVNEVEIKHWDPFFYPEGDFFSNGADIVFCLEVIEHFENPIEGFQGLARACSYGGLVAVKTMIAPSTFEQFAKWWYKDDFTHVSFYTNESVEHCARRVGLIFEKELDGVLFLRKNIKKM